jgi:hypothetical protein
LVWGGGWAGQCWTHTDLRCCVIRAISLDMASETIAATLLTLMEGKMCEDEYQKVSQVQPGVTDTIKSTSALSSISGNNNSIPAPSDTELTMAASILSSFLAESKVTVSSCKQPPNIGAYIVLENGQRLQLSTTATVIGRAAFGETGMGIKSPHIDIGNERCISRYLQTEFES